MWAGGHQERERDFDLEDGVSDEEVFDQVCMEKPNFRTGRPKGKVVGSAKPDLVEHIYRNTLGIEKQVIEKVVDMAFDNLFDRIIAGERIEIRGFGTFGSKTTKPRNCHNVATGQMYTTTARRRPKWTPVPELIHPHGANQQDSAKSHDTSGAAAPIPPTVRRAGE